MLILLRCTRILEMKSSGEQFMSYLWYPSRDSKKTKMLKTPFYLKCEDPRSLSARAWGTVTIHIEKCEIHNRKLLYCACVCENAAWSVPASLHVRLWFECSTHVNVFIIEAGRWRGRSVLWIYGGMARKMAGVYRYCEKDCSVAGRQNYIR